MAWEVCRFVCYLIPTKRTTHVQMRFDISDHSARWSFCPLEQILQGHCTRWAGFESGGIGDVTWAMEAMVKQQSLPTIWLLNKMCIYEFLVSRPRTMDTPMKVGSSSGWGNRGVKDWWPGIHVQPFNSARFAIFALVPWAIGGLILCSRHVDNLEWRCFQVKWSAIDAIFPNHCFCVVLDIVSFRKG